jgi:hypothetical protein
MGALHQLVIASLAAAFSIGLLVTAQHFIEYRSARSSAITFIERSHVPREPEVSALRLQHFD